MDVNELIKKVKKLELKTKKQSSELFSGNYSSNFKGRGMSFSEVRKYQYGDDIRAIDWNVTSRSQEPHIKEFEEERELTFILLVDVSPSTQYGSGKAFKRDIINEIAATISFSALQNNDKVGVIFFSDKIEKYIPPKKGKAHILTIIRDLIDIESLHSRTDVGLALRFLQNTVKKKSVVFLLSDFIDSPSFERELAISTLRNQFYALQIYDDAEHDIPNIGVVKLKNTETDEYFWADTSSSEFKQMLHQQFANNQTKIKQLFEKLGNKFSAIDIEQPYMPKLAAMFSK